MREIFDCAYEGVCNSMLVFIEYSEVLGRCILTGLVYLTIPLWIVPYSIYKNLKGGAE